MRAVDQKNKKVNPIEQQKQDAREVRTILKNQKQEEKVRKQEQEEERKRLLKEERMFAGSNSKRAREDARKEKKKADRGSPESCVHGIIKCRICNPPQAKVNHRAAALQQQDSWNRLA
jgi:predicted ribosome quality control (RQC) complex YloA/Tae2 family protein